jgi:nicotinamide-nucleotide amidase
VEALVVSPFPEALLASARALLDLCRARGLKIATAESCTGGLVAALLTEIAGSSDVVERGFVTYSNEAKRELLGVRADTLAAHGAVSEATAREMASGALAASRADLAVGERRFGDIGRSEVRFASVAQAVAMLETAALT